MIQRFKRATIANPGANSSVVIYDDANDPIGESTNKARLRMTAYLDQNFTVNTYWGASSTASLRLVEADAKTTSANAVHAAKPITCVAKASLTDNDYFAVTYTTVIDGTTTATTVTYEYKVTGGFVATAGRTTLDVTGATTATSVAVITAAQIAADFSMLTVPVPTTATLTATAKQSGTRFAVTATENVANAGFTLGATVTGVEGYVITKDIRLLPGRNMVVLVTATAPVEFDVACETTDDVSLGASA